MRIILVRHGQTEWNRVERFRGRVDLALNDTGLSQAEAIADKIANWQASALYTSPLKRAIMTAEIITSHLHLPAQPLSGLLDIDYGTWQGLSPEEAQEQDRQLYSQWLQTPHRVTFPQGESLGEVRQRVVAAVEDVVAKHSDETAAMVSHKVVCKVLLCAVLGLDNSHFWQVEQDVGAVNVFEAGDGNFVVTLLNDTCHLRNLGR